MREMLNVCVWMCGYDNDMLTIFMDDECYNPELELENVLLIKSEQQTNQAEKLTNKPSTKIIYGAISCCVVPWFSTITSSTCRLAKWKYILFFVPLIFICICALSFLYAHSVYFITFVYSTVLLLSLSCVNFLFSCAKSLKVVFFLAALFNFQTEEFFLYCGKNLEMNIIHTWSAICYSKHAYSHCAVFFPSAWVIPVRFSFSLFTLHSKILVEPVRRNPSSSFIFSTAWNFYFWW